MSKLKMVGAAVGGVVVLGLMGIGGGWMWASSQVTTIFDKDWESHDVDFPIPFPLSETDLAALKAELAAAPPAGEGEGGDGAAQADGAQGDGEGEGDGDADPLAGVDLDAKAKEVAIARGKHYVESIYACTACHGSDLTGGTMIDDPAIGTLRGPNITSGGKTAKYTPRDWDRSVRHGILPTGKTSMMPVLDFKNLTDRELSDIISYVRSLGEKPGSDTVREFGPVGTMLVATGQLVPDVYNVKDHMAAHAVEPPPPTPDKVYGEHVIAICSGCHREGFNGGPMPFGPPDWPPAANLTPHADGLAGWNLDDFKNALRNATSKDGTKLRPPMSEMVPFAHNMTETEITAMFAYLSSLPPTPTGE